MPTSPVTRRGQASSLAGATLAEAARELAAVVDARLLVWFMPEMIFPCTLVAVPPLAAGKSSPLTSFDEPVMVVVPVPFAAPKPITFPLIVWKLPFAPVVPDTVMPE